MTKGCEESVNRPTHPAWSFADRHFAMALGGSNEHARDVRTEQHGVANKCYAIEVCPWPGGRARACGPQSLGFDSPEPMFSA